MTAASAETILDVLTNGCSAPSSWRRPARVLAAANPALTSMVEGFLDHVRDSYSHRGLSSQDAEADLP